MKKILAMMMALVSLAVVLTACNNNGGQSSNTNNSSQSQAKDVDLKAVADQIDQEIGIAMKQEVDADILEAVYGITPEDYEEAAGYITMINVKTNNVVLVKAKEGRVDAVKAALENKRSEIEEQFKTYLQDQYEIAKEGKVVVLDNYVALFILEDVVNGQKTPAESVQRAEEIFTEAIRG